MNIFDFRLLISIFLLQFKFVPSCHLFSIYSLFFFLLLLLLLMLINKPVYILNLFFMMFLFIFIYIPFLFLRIFIFFIFFARNKEKIGKLLDFLRIFVIHMTACLQQKLYWSFLENTNQEKIIIKIYNIQTNI